MTELGLRKQTSHSQLRRDIGPPPLTVLPNPAAAGARRIQYEAREEGISRTQTPQNRQYPMEAYAKPSAAIVHIRRRSQDHNGSANVPDFSQSNFDQQSFDDNPQEYPHSDPSHDSRPMSTRSYTSSDEAYDTSATSSLPALQVRGPPNSNDCLEPLEEEDDPQSYDLIAPPVGDSDMYSLETRTDQLFSKEHLNIIFSDPPLLLKFTAYLSACRPKSVPVLIYYLDATKALKAISYANAVASSLEAIESHDFTITPTRVTTNSTLETKASQAFNVLVREDLPAYVTHQYIQIVSASIIKRVTGTLAPHLREASEGLAEVFCLTDPSRPDNPIVFASEEFHRTTQYGMSYVIGRNCRFLQGPKTDPFSVRRIRQSVEKGKEHCEVFLNYRRDGSPFLNLLMTAPLCDSRGRIRYFIGAQVDVSGLAKDCTEFESLSRLLEEQSRSKAAVVETQSEKKDEFQELSEMLNTQELETVRRCGGQMHREQEDDLETASTWHRPRLVLKEDGGEPARSIGPSAVERIANSGKLSGVYSHYLLIRPYPSLRILFASPTLRVPGILQSPFLNKIGGSARVHSELMAAFAEGRGITAKVRWVSKADEDGRNRWIHCTPLLGSNKQIGVWMVVLVDEEQPNGSGRRWRQAPPVNPQAPRKPRSRQPSDAGIHSAESIASLHDRYFGEERGVNKHMDAVRTYNTADRPTSAASRASSPFSVTL